MIGARLSRTKVIDTVLCACKHTNRKDRWCILATLARRLGHLGESILALKVRVAATSSSQTGKRSRIKKKARPETHRKILMIPDFTMRAVIRILVIRNFVYLQQCILKYPRDQCNYTFHPSLCNAVCNFDRKKHHEKLIKAIVKRCPIIIINL